MDFTREPIVETVITPKEGFKLVVRSSKSSGQEEYFVDAVEVVSFGNSFFFRSLERPKSFLVPATDYELLEVREARMVLKNVGLDRSIKIGGGREAPAKQQREPAPEKAASAEPSAQPAEEMAEARVDKRRDKRRHTRRRRGRDDVKEGSEESSSSEGEAKIDIDEPLKLVPRESSSAEPLTTSSSVLSSILPPPPTLISDTIARYKENAMFKGAFFMKDEEQKQGSEQEEQPKDGEEAFPISIEEPHLTTFSIDDEEEGDLFQHRTTLAAEEPPLNHPEEPSNS